jgi:subtilase family serine protease
MPGSPDWYHAGGTSISAPLFAGITADAVQFAGHRLGRLGPALYQMHGAGDGILDVTQGSNTDHGVRGYSAAPGYDALTELTGVFPQVVSYFDHLAVTVSGHDHSGIGWPGVAGGTTGRQAGRDRGVVDAVPAR